MMKDKDLYFHDEETYAYAMENGNVYVDQNFPDISVFTDMSHDGGRKIVHQHLIDLIKFEKKFHSTYNIERFDGRLRHAFYKESDDSGKAIWSQSVFCAWDSLQEEGLDLMHYNERQVCSRESTLDALSRILKTETALKTETHREKYRLACQQVLFFITDKPILVTEEKIYDEVMEKIHEDHIKFCGIAPGSDGLFQFCEADRAVCEELLGEEYTDEGLDVSLTDCLTRAFQEVLSFARSSSVLSCSNRDIHDYVGIPDKLFAQRYKDFK